MEYATLVILLALVQYIYFLTKVGLYRGKVHIQAPACDGDESFERLFRVQQNTLEQLIIFIPSLYCFAVYVNPVWGAMLGSIYIIGRFVYAAAYFRNPADRGPGMLMTLIPNCLLVAGAIAGIILKIIQYE